MQLKYLCLPCGLLPLSLAYFTSFTPRSPSFSPYIRRHSEQTFSLLPLFQSSSDGHDYSEVDRLLEIANQGPEDEADLRRIAEEKLDAAEAALEQQKVDLKAAIEEERMKADEARKERTTEAMADVGSKIDNLIDGFFDSIDAEDEDKLGSDAASGASPFGDVTFSSNDLLIPPKSVLSVPFTSNTPLLYSTTIDSSSLPTHLVISTSPKSYSPSNVNDFLKTLPDLKHLRTLIILSNLGTDRPVKGLAAMFGSPSVQNTEAELNLLSSLRKLTKFNDIPLTHHVVKTQIEGSKEVSKEAKGGVAVPGFEGGCGGFGNGAALGVGDIFDGKCEKEFLEGVVDNLLGVDVAEFGNKTISLVSVSPSSPVSPSEISYLMKKIEGPEIMRMAYSGIPSPNGLRIFILEVLRRFKSGVSKFTVEEEGDNSVIVKFKESAGVGYDDKDSSDSEGRSKSTSTPVFAGLKEGGLRLSFDEIGGGNMVVRVERCDYPKEWEKRKVAVKEMTEDSIVREVKKRVEEWVKDHRT
ncbi:hypothetical protein TrST_g9281 [Triparma strigata]|uniref:Uncharacterized protein n=1 Tax=Triparma strigata TaxID=1606541 RepID=A0A9W7A5P8_9STRA|nr:hypothetical protein TrST_g9281 [Triparma strigata]